MGKFKVVVTDDRYNTYETEKKVLDEIGAYIKVENCTTPEQVIEACKDADGILLNLAPMGADVIDGLLKCKVISRYGVGYDNVDVGACTKKSIQVTNVPDYCQEEVSDHALALLMSCIRKTARRDAQVRNGQWNIGQKDPIYRIAGKTLTLLGFGSIARCLLRKVRGLDFEKILVYDPYVDEKTIIESGCQKVDWDTALSLADYISVHMPLNDSTKGIIDKAAFDKMKKDAIIINTSRGPVIDEKALIDSLLNGKINSAGLDVHCSEPLDEDSLLLKLENCVLTDHIGWYSEESIIELKRKAAENIRDVLIGQKPAYMVNKI